MESGKLKKLLYVAGPYSGDIINNIARAEEVSISLIRNGFHVLTPHKNTAGYEKYEGNGISQETWIEMGINLLSRCDAIYVMINSSKSLGTQREIEFAEKNNIPVIYELECPHQWLTLSMFSEMIRGS